MDSINRGARKAEVDGGDWIRIVEDREMCYVTSPYTKGQIRKIKGDLKRHDILDMHTRDPCDLKRYVHVVTYP